MTFKKFKHIAISIFYRVIHPFRKLYWFVFRPQTRGAKAVIFWQGKVLLARNSYGHRKWTLPGGGVGRKETFQDAAIREAGEEVGIKADNATFFYEYKSVWEYKNDTVQCFVMNVHSESFLIDEQEISEAGWFSPDDLPSDIRARVKEVLLKYSEWQKTHG